MDEDYSSRVLENARQKKADDVTLAEEEGDSLFRLFVDNLMDPNLPQLYDYQIKFCWKAILGQLPKMYGKAWILKSGEILERYGLQRIEHEFFLIAHRRVGKTEVLCRFVAALALTMSGTNDHPYKIAIFSNTEDTAKETITAIYNRLINIAYSKNFAITKNAKKIKIRNPTRDDSREIFCKCSHGPVSSSTPCCFRCEYH
jgi:hypothetical protein